MHNLATSITYTSIPSDQQVIVGAVIFLLTYLTPLAVAALTLHRLPKRLRVVTDMSLATLFTFLAMGMPAGVQAEGYALFFAMIAVAISIDLLRLGRVAQCFATCTLIPSLSVLLSSIGPALVNALHTSSQYQYP